MSVASPRQQPGQGRLDGFQSRFRSAGYAATTT